MCSTERSVYSSPIQTGLVLHREESFLQEYLLSEYVHTDCV